MLYSWGRTTSTLIIKSGSFFSPTHFIPLCPLSFNVGCKRNSVKQELVFEGMLILMTLLPLTVAVRVFALLYFVILCPKIIQKKAEGGEECWSSPRSCVSKSPDFIQLCAISLPALSPHQQDLCSLSWQILTSYSILTHPCSCQNVLMLSCEKHLVSKLNATTYPT